MLVDVERVPRVVDPPVFYGQAAKVGDAFRDFADFGFDFFVQDGNADGAEIFFLQLGQAEFHGHAAVVDFIDDEHILAFQRVGHGVEPLDFFDFFRYLSFVVAVVIGGGYGVNRDFQKAAQHTGGDEAAAADGDHGIVFDAGVLDFFRQRFDHAVDVVVGVPDFLFHGDSRFNGVYQFELQGFCAAF